MVRIADMTKLWRVWLVVVLFGAGWVSTAHAERRIAMVVGNSGYLHTTELLNPINDASDLSNKLTGLGFEVLTGNDLTGDEFSRLLVQFSQKLQGADVALFFYAGHGIQYRETNYLVPIDAKLSNSFSLKREAISLNDILEQMETLVPTNLIFLDACRDNPLASVLEKSIKSTGRSARLSRGLAPVQSRGNDTLITFAAAPGALAADGVGRNSPFTKALLKHIETPGVEIEVMLKRVTREVRVETQQKQEPERLSRLTREFYFNGRRAADKPVAGKPSQSSAAQPKQNPVSSELIELTFWNSIRDSKDHRDYESYVTKYPNGSFVGLAMRRIASLQAAKSNEVVTRTIPQAAPVPELISPSFNCNRARLAAELAICGSGQLARYDRELSDLYRQLKDRMSRTQRKRLDRVQKGWLAQRNRCGGQVDCIGTQYRQRISYFHSLLGG